MKHLIFLFLVSFPLITIGQNSIQKEISSRLINLNEVSSSDENFEGYEQLKSEIGDAEIVMMGEQSHSDATTFETKIKLIKYLHQEMGFDVLAFESNLYECKRAWTMIQDGHDVKDAMAKGIFGTWTSLEELNPLYQYVERQMELENPLEIAGFDPQYMGKMAVDYFGADLSAYISTFEDLENYQAGIDQLQSYITVKRVRTKISKEITNENLAFLKELSALIKNQRESPMSNFWIQALKNLAVFISDVELGTDDRDKMMAENLIWFKEKHPNKKIICWGATSHFLYNSATINFENILIQKSGGAYYKDHSMMGDYIKEEYGDKVYTIGFVAHQGYFGSGRMVKIDTPSENNLEYLIGQSPGDNYFMSLKNISLEGYLSRPLAHQNITNDIAKVMDGLVFNRYMRMPYTDWDFFLYLFPESTLRKKKVEKLKRNTSQRKLDDVQRFGNR